jgi:hypothetical protein
LVEWQAEEEGLKLGCGVARKQRAERLIDAAKSSWNNCGLGESQ